MHKPKPSPESRTPLPNLRDVLLERVNDTRTETYSEIEKPRTKFDPSLVGFGIISPAMHVSKAQENVVGNPPLAEWPRGSKQEGAK